MQNTQVRLNPKAEEFKPNQGCFGNDVDYFIDAPKKRLNPNAAPFGQRQKVNLNNTCVSPPSPMNPPGVGAPLSRYCKGLPVRRAVPAVARPVEQPTAEKVIVSTPWYSKGIDKSIVRLNDEATAFHSFISLTESEIAQRNKLRESVDLLASLRWPESRCMVYGSFAIGTSASTSAVDIMIDNCGTLTTRNVKEAFQAVGTIKSLMCVGASAFTQIESPEGILANISLHKDNGSQTTKASVDMCRKWLSLAPYMREVYSILRQIMTQTGNLEVSKGGLSAYALLAMLGFVAKNTLHYTSGELLVAFCHYFGMQFDSQTYAIDVAKGRVAPKKNTADALYIIDPCDTSSNLAGDCTRMFRIKSQLAHCYNALMKWDEVHDKKYYRGRTPLSGVISHQQLWERSELLQDSTSAVDEINVQLSVESQPLQPTQVLSFSSSEVQSIVESFHLNLNTSSTGTISPGLSDSPASLLDIIPETGLLEFEALEPSKNELTEDLLKCIDEAIANDLSCF